MRPLVRLLVIFFGHDSEPTLSDPPVANKAASITDYHNSTASKFPSQKKVKEPATRKSNEQTTRGRKVEIPSSPIFSHLRINRAPLAASKHSGLHTGPPIPLLNTFAWTLTRRSKEVTGILDILPLANQTPETVHLAGKL